MEPFMIELILKLVQETLKFKSKIFHGLFLAEHFYIAQILLDFYFLQVFLPV